MSAQEFDSALQAIISSSKGGIPSGTKIKEVASICVNNVQVKKILLSTLAHIYTAMKAFAAARNLACPLLHACRLLATAGYPSQDAW
jgi:hypothetical protein